MPRNRTLRDRIEDVGNAIETTRKHTVAVTLSRDDLRDAIRALADAVEDLAFTFRVTHGDELQYLDIPAHHRPPPRPTEK